MTEHELRRLAGSLVMVGFRGLTAGPETLIHRHLSELNLAGVILFDVDAATGERGRNIADPSQLIELCAQLRQAGGRQLLIAVDQEGGSVARLNPHNGFPASDSHAQLGEADDVAATRSAAMAIAAILRDAGINVNFAPVVDLATNPDNPVIAGRGRSFAADAARVIAHAGAFIDAHAECGVVCALKHFPGHGSSRHDTHVVETDVTDTFADDELAPYRVLCAQPAPPLVMAGHLRHRTFDPELPASLSRKMLTGLLRHDIGFDGVIVTDDLDMAAVAERYDLVDRVDLALNAGVDLLLFGNNLRFDPRRPEQVVDAIAQCVRTGRLSVDCLMEQRRRLDRLRQGPLGK